MNDSGPNAPEREVVAAPGARDASSPGASYDRRRALRDADSESPGSESYPLAPMQQGMFFHWLRDPRGGVDLEQVTCTIEALRRELFVDAWTRLSQRHGLLRTVFRWQDVDVPVQQVLPEVPVVVHEEDLRTLSSDAQRSHLERWLDADRTRGFDFAAPPLFRLALFRTAESRHEFVWTFPHILLDGRSFVILIRELLETHRTLEAGGEPSREPPPRFRDFVEWLEQHDPAPARAYWARTLGDFSEPVYPELGAVAADPDRPPYAEASLCLSREETSALKAFATTHDVTLNTLVQAAWALLLSRYTGSGDVVFGATRACRRTALGGDPRVADMVGLFINTLPVRVRIRADETVTALLRRIREDQVAVRVAEHASLMDVQVASAVPPGVPLFETMLVFENQQQATNFDALDPRFHHFRLREKTTFPLTLHGYAEDELLLRFEYYTDRFDDASVARMLGHLATLLREMLAKGEAPVRDLEMLTELERVQLAAWNATDDPDIARPTTLAALLAERAAECGDDVALTFGNTSMTYRELDARADVLARTLVHRGVAPGILVGICMERSLELIVGLVGILKAGGAYVPLDPDYPADRLEFMLSDARCAVLLTQQKIAETKLASLAPGATVLCVDTDWDAIAAESAAAPAAPMPSPDDLAYVIYTSGSTGQPKGAMNRHRGVVNFLLWMRREYGLTRGDAVLQKTPVSFDLSVPELFVPLISGARLVLAEPGAQGDPGYLAKVMCEQEVTVMYIVPSLLRAFLDAEASSAPVPLRNVTCSGEALPWELQERFFARWPGAKMYNLYGPTEAAVEATYGIGWPNDSRRMVPVGRPIANTHIHILDASAHQAPIGVPGELFIGGVQVGAGYLRRDELTAERFVPDPFSLGVPGARLYRTGDRARWLSDGTVEYLGRLDFLVKLRGFRIEVGEIEAALSADAAVRECVVVLRNDPGIEPRLVAYYVPAGVAPATSAELRGGLEGKLPSHMVPWVYVPLAALPLSPSGKLDRKALPAPEGAMPAVAAVEPRDAVEARVLRIWEDVLGRSGFGVTHHFNEVGGNSLAAVRVFSRIAKEFERQLQLVTILKHNTVDQIAALLRDPAPADEWRCIVPLNATTTGIPVFCPHAQTGNVLIYQHFAKEVAAHHPVFGIQAYGNWGAQEPHESMEEMVAFYVREILAVRPRGPYVFLGGSLGGYIALELARAIGQLGHEVRMLAMYDTVGPDYPHYTLFGRVAKFVLSHGGIPFWRIRQVVARDGAQGRSLRRMYWKARETARWWYYKTRRDYLYWKYEERNPPHDFAMPANLTRVRLASRRVVRHYHVTSYAGKIVYFRADVQPTGSIHDPMNGWAGLATQFEIHPVPSGHTGGMSYPVVIGLAKTFLECVARESERDVLIGV